MDLISRQAAIDAVMKLMPSLTTPDGSGQFDAEIFRMQEMFVDIWHVLNDMPSAQPEIIRCKECKWHIDIRSLNTDENKNARLCVLFEKHMSMQDYCSYAERRTDE